MRVPDIGIADGFPRNALGLLVVADVAHRTRMAVRIGMQVLYTRLRAGPLSHVHTHAHTHVHTHGYAQFHAHVCAEVQEHISYDNN